MRVVVIGCGGVFTQIMIPLSQYLNYYIKDDVEMVLCDGDIYEEKNKDRQLFSEFGNKAQSSCGILEPMFPEIKYRIVTDFVDKKNIKDLIKDGDIVVTTVDNHNTRMIIHNHISQNRKNVLVIDGTNDYYDGNTMTYFVDDKGNVNGKLPHELHKEIANGESKAPFEMSCEERSRDSDPQLVVTNFNNGAIILNNIVTAFEKKYVFNETFFDVTVNKSRSKTKIDLE